MVELSKSLEAAGSQHNSDHPSVGGVGEIGDPAAPAQSIEHGRYGRLLHGRCQSKLSRAPRSVLQEPEDSVLREAKIRIAHRTLETMKHSDDRACAKNPRRQIRRATRYLHGAQCIRCV